MTSFLLKVSFWLLYTQSGELDELDFYGEEYSFLHDIHGGLPFTFHKDNPYLQQEFVISARNRAKPITLVPNIEHFIYQNGKRKTAEGVGF